MNRRTTTLPSRFRHGVRTRAGSRASHRSRCSPDAFWRAHAAHARIDLRQGERDHQARSRDREGHAPRPGRPNDPLAQEDIFGPGAVLTVGNIQMKVINNGDHRQSVHEHVVGPVRGSGRAPRESSTSNAIVLAVGAVNPTATRSQCRSGA